MKKVVWFGTSLSKSLDCQKFERDTDTKVKVVKAFGIKGENNQFYPRLNFTKLVPEVLEDEKPDAIVLQAGSVEISNIIVKNAMMDTERDLDSYRSEWATKVEEDSANLFAIAENAVKEYPDLKVIILKRLPRFDSYTVDPLRVKQKLSKFANKIELNAKIQSI